MFDSKKVIAAIRNEMIYQLQGIFLIDKLSQITNWKGDSRWKPDNPQAEP